MATNRGSKDFFTHDDSGKAVFDGHDLAELAERFPTPFYLISQKQLRANFEQFKQAIEKNDGPGVKPGDEFAHSTRLLLVDREGVIRGVYPGLPDEQEHNSAAAFAAALDRLKSRARELAR